MNSVLILDPYLAGQYLASRVPHDRDRFDEVWDGRLVIPPIPDNEHALLRGLLPLALASVVDLRGGDVVAHGGNVSDRDEGWDTNFRIPDVLVVLQGSVAVDRGTHWQGGPDLVVEIISLGEDPKAKFDFYAAVKTREVLVVDRDPWAVELFRRRGKKFVLAGRSDEANEELVVSDVLTLSLQLVRGTPRPRLSVRHTAARKKWLI